MKIKISVPFTNAVKIHRSSHPSLRTMNARVISREAPDSITKANIVNDTIRKMYPLSWLPPGGAGPAAFIAQRKYRNIDRIILTKIIQQSSLLKGAFEDLEEKRIKNIQAT